jgi:CheY-like chemotaxis protein
MQTEDLRVLSGLKLLIMYDEPEELDVTKQTLSFYGAEVIACTEVSEGLERLQTDKPNVIICDLGTFPVKGYQFLWAMRNLPADKGRDTPAVALSVWSRKEVLVKAINAGFQRYFCKPLQLSALVETIAGLARKQQDPKGKQASNIQSA